MVFFTSLRLKNLLNIISDPAEASVMNSESKKLLRCVTAVYVGFALALLSACSQVGFVGGANTETKVVTNASDGLDSRDLKCEIMSQLHPEVDAMLFAVKVSDANLRLDIPGRYDEAPQTIGEEFIFSGVPLPVDLNGKVSVGVFLSTNLAPEDIAAVSPSNSNNAEDVISEPKRYACEGAVTALSLRGSELSAQDSESAVFKLTWDNLYPSEELRFISEQSAFSPDLNLSCEGESVHGVVGAKSTEEDGLFHQVFNCTVRFIRPYGVKSIRYKNQRFVWDFVRNGKVVRSIDRPVTLDLILSANSSAADSSESDTVLVDPETCKSIGDKRGQQFTHLCDAKQSILKPADGESQEVCLEIQDRCRQPGMPNL